MQKFISQDIIDNIKIHSDDGKSISATLNKKKIFIKIINFEEITDLQVKELEIQLKFDHPFIIKPLGFYYLSKSILWIVYEFYEKSLESLIQQGNLTLENKIKITKNLIELLSKFQETNYVCNNLNLKNIRFSRNNVLKLVNMKESVFKETHSIFDAPEVLLHNKNTSSSDVWSLGVVLVSLFKRETFNLLIENLIESFRKNETPPDFFANIENLYIKGFIISLLRFREEERPSIEEITRIYNNLIERLNFDKIFSIQTQKE